MGDQFGRANLDNTSLDTIKSRSVCMLQMWIKYKMLECSSNPFDMVGQLLFYFLQVGRRFKP
jgi:hypothetical protein